MKMFIKTWRRRLGLASLVASSLVSSCKPGTISNLASLENFAGGSLVTNSCLGSDEARTSEVVRSLVQNSIGADSQALRLAATDAVSAVPATVLEQFVALGGKLRFLEDPTTVCGLAYEALHDGEFDRDGLPLESPSIDACFTYAPQTETNERAIQVILPRDPALVRHLTVRQFGYLWSQRLSRMTFSTKGSGLVVTDHSKEGVGYREAKATIARAFLTDLAVSPVLGLGRMQSLLGMGAGTIIRENLRAGRRDLFQGVAFDSQIDRQPSAAERTARQNQFVDFAFAEAFDSFYCNAATAVPGGAFDAVDSAPRAKKRAALVKALVRARHAGASLAYLFPSTARAFAKIDGSHFRQTRLLGISLQDEGLFDYSTAATGGDSDACPADGGGEESTATDTSTDTNTDANTDTATATATTDDPTVTSDLAQNPGADAFDGDTVAQDPTASGAWAFPEFTDEEGSAYDAYGYLSPESGLTTAEPVQQVAATQDYYTNELPSEETDYAPALQQANEMYAGSPDPVAGDQTFALGNFTKRVLACVRGASVPGAPTTLQRKVIKEAEAIADKAEQDVLDAERAARIARGEVDEIDPKTGKPVFDKSIRAKALAAGEKALRQHLEEQVAKGVKEISGVNPGMYPIEDFRKRTEKYALTKEAFDGIVDEKGTKFNDIPDNADTFANKRLLLIENLDKVRKPRTTVAEAEQVFVANGKPISHDADIVKGLTVNDANLTFAEELSEIKVYQLDKPVTQSRTSGHFKGTDSSYKGDYPSRGTNNMVGPFLAPKPAEDFNEALNGYAVQTHWNAMQDVGEVEIPAGTRIAIGRAGPQFDKMTQKWLPGGEPQIYILPDASEIITDSAGKMKIDYPKYRARMDKFGWSERRPLKGSAIVP